MARARRWAGEPSEVSLSLVADGLTPMRVAEIVDRIDLPAAVFVVEHHSVPGILRGRIEEAAGLTFYAP